MMVSSNSDNMAPNNGISELWIGKDVEGSNNGIIYSTKYPRKTGEKYTEHQWGPPQIQGTSGTR